MIRTFSLPILAATLAHGQISFGPSQEISDAISTGIGFAKATDMDGDGDLDAVVAEAYGARILWWKNDGSGNFSSRSEWLWPEPSFQVIGLEDRNGDGLVDVWLRESTYDEDSETFDVCYFIAENDGSGNFGEPSLLHSETEPFSYSGTPTLLKINNDSHWDIATSGGLLLSDQSGNSFTSFLPIQDPFGNGGLYLDRCDLFTIDVNSDDLVDLFIDYRFGGPFYLVQNSEGFPEAVLVDLGLPSDESIIQIKTTVVHTGDPADPLRLVSLIEDYLTNHYFLNVFRLNHPDSPELLSTTELPHDSFWFDLETDPTSGRIFILSSSNQTTDEPTSNIYEVGINSPVSSLTLLASVEGLPDQLGIAVLDINGDQLEDLFLPVARLPGVSFSATDRLLWIEGASDGTFSSVVHEITSGEENLELLEVADFDGDGKTDVLAGFNPLFSVPKNGYAHLKLWTGFGAGKFQEPAIIEGDWDLIEVLGVADIAGVHFEFGDHNPEYGKDWPSGRMDILVQTWGKLDGDSMPRNRIEWLLQDENGNFIRTLIRTLEEESQLPRQHWVDWDGDDHLDLVTQINDPTLGNTVSWRKGSGYLFGAPELIVSLPYQYSFYPDEGINDVNDVDWDGDLDFITATDFFGEQSPVWLENRGDGQIISIRDFGMYLSLCVDIDGDGHKDFASGESFLLARPGVTFESRTTPWISGGHKPIFVDLDNDGDVDAVQAFFGVKWWENVGDGRFIPNNSAGRLLAGYRPVTPTMGLHSDIDGDAVPDLILSSSPGAPRLEWIKITQTPEPAPFTSVMETLGLTGHSAGPFSDWDLDGMLNWDEFAFGSNPAVSDPNHPGRPHLEQSPSGTTYTFQRRTDAASLGLSYDTEHSINLREWEPWTPSPTVDSPSGNYERVSLPAPITQDKEFFRTTVSEPPAP